MQSRTIRRALVSAVTLGALAVPATASAATVTVSGDDGNPVATPATIRNMAPDVAAAFPPGEGRYKLTVTGPTGAAAASGVTCSGRTTGSANRVDYQGNGAYTVVVTNYTRDDFRCATPVGPAESFTFTIAAGTAVTAPGATFLLRQAGSFSTNPLSVGIALNPGAPIHEVRFAPNATIGPDGAIVGNSQKTSADSTGTARLFVSSPGVYTVVARPTRFTSAGEVGGPWSAPVRITVLAPFDVSGGLQFLDSRGPSYRVRIQLRERSARGRVAVSLARGSRGGTYRSLGTSARISSSGTVTKAFRVTRSGTYRLRFSYKGSGTILGGRVTYPIRITRRVSFG